MAKIKKAMLKYITDHWRGRQGPGWSFWVNLVALRGVVFLAQEGLSPPAGQSYAGQAEVVMIALGLFHGVLFVWQVTGVLRSSEHILRNHGSMAYVWGAQLGVLIAFWLTLSYALDGWYMTRPLPETGRKNPTYRLEISPDKKALTLSGTIAPGITREFVKLLEHNAGIKTIILDSAGGNIYEARGLSKQIRQRGLDTLVETQCSSACATVFIGGKHRSMKKSARLGFHQYRIDADYNVPFIDSAAEQERDRAIFTASKIKPWFLEKAFERSPQDMWFPSAELLTNANVVHALLD